MVMMGDLLGGTCAISQAPLIKNLNYKINFE